MSPVQNTTEKTTKQNLAFGDLLFPTLLTVLSVATTIYSVSDTGKILWLIGAGVSITWMVKNYIDYAIQQCKQG